MQKLPGFVVAVAFLILGASAAAKTCTLIADAETGQVIVRNGPCDRRASPASTFKIPIALMGFDSGILTDPASPTWSPEQSDTINFPTDNRPTGPSTWLAYSVVWYSQRVTGKLGMNAFSKYLNSFEYGNRDLSGDLGLNNGLARAWLSSSLQISADEQMSFLRRLWGRVLPVSASAVEKTIESIPVFQVEGWSIRGKTGSGRRAVEPAGKDTEPSWIQHGWFVGRAEKDGHAYLFVRVVFDDQPEQSFAGPRARDGFFRDFPAIMKAIQN